MTTWRPDSRARSVPVADVLSREGRDLPGRSPLPRRVAGAAAGLAVAAGALLAVTGESEPRDVAGTQHPPAPTTPVAQPKIPSARVAEAAVVAPPAAAAATTQVQAPVPKQAVPVQRKTEAKAEPKPAQAKPATVADRIREAMAPFTQYWGG
ncbi:hypothetical protein [Actinokineospora iranica]|uniref:Angiomotin n=1 Tax=Actinokineospora iranica TaxID=1271860 RepID=A0A1G6YT75_9PSEU|nr:hypothetical protein [Actinokineospora iranica]SDD92746.1 angiomotin [Actinokineospora iranica]